MDKVKRKKKNYASEYTPEYKQYSCISLNKISGLGEWKEYNEKLKKSV